jgi:16S rRNA (cytosine1402-N4)-methyltransferase
MNLLNEKKHISVMQNECISFLKECRLKIFFDGTLGAGGHAEAILASHPEIEKYIGCDRDPRALALANENLAPWKEKIVFMHGNFADLDLMLEEKAIDQVDGFFLTWGYRLCN